MKLKSYFFTVLSLALLMVSCQEKENLIQPERNIEVTVLDGDNNVSAPDIRIQCEGDCTNGDNRGCGVTNSDLGPTEVGCTCSGCKMKITFSSRYAPSDPTENADVVINKHNDFIRFTFQKLHKKYGDNLVNVNSIEFTKGKTTDVILYEFTLEDGTDSSIMYSNEHNNGTKTGDKTYEIDCVGSCDCREVYDFGSNEASCSCSNCKMFVRLVEE